MNQPTAELSQADRRFFDAIAPSVERFTRAHNLLLYKHPDNPTWYLQFRHPCGGQADIVIGRTKSGTAGIFGQWNRANYRKRTCQIARDRKTFEIGTSDPGFTDVLLEALRRVLQWTENDLEGPEALILNRDFLAWVWLLLGWRAERSRPIPRI